MIKNYDIIKINKQLKEDNEMAEFFDNCFDSGAIRIREAFYGT